MREWAVNTDPEDFRIEIHKELTSIGGSRPPTAIELATVVDKQTLTLPGRWETGKAVAQSIAEIVRFGFADDYWNTYAGRVRALELGEVSAVAESVLHPEKLVWVVVGDAEKIEPGIRALELGEIRRLDSDGRRLGTAD